MRPHRGGMSAASILDAARPLFPFESVMSQFIVAPTLPQFDGNTRYIFQMPSPGGDDAGMRHNAFASGRSSSKCLSQCSNSNP